jgi:purine nucleosidase
MTAILIDTDPGQDDALAILLALASPSLSVQAITAVAGNVPLALAAANARRVCDLAGQSIPVFAGAASPLIFGLETAEFVCGPDGLAGATLPAASRDPEAEHGVLALIRIARATPGLTICALGPLTNLALALRLAPDLAGSLGRVIWMGGALGLGNMTPAAEFNAYVDPHAVAIVLDAGLRLTLIGLNVTQSVIASPAALARLAAMPGRTAAAVHGWLTRSRPGGLGTAGHPMHDPCVIAALLWPELFTLRACHVAVETSAGPLRGRTTIDWNGRLRLPSNADVVEAVDVPTLFDRMIDALETLP